MTGRDSFRTGMQFGIVDNSAAWGLPFDEVTLAERFQAAGYSTHMVRRFELETGEKSRPLVGNPRSLASLCVSLCLSSSPLCRVHKACLERLCSIDRVFEAVGVDATLVLSVPLASHWRQEPKPFAVAGRLVVHYCNVGYRTQSLIHVSTYRFDIEYRKHSASSISIRIR